ncbi:LexA/Signal peptidase [Paxillus ammoniavirescens]|nr:LexA/Signal peptidase [Paxillus ammoniavirescens]
MLGLGCLHAVNLACLLHLFKENVGSPCLTYGPSMLPTFESTGEIAIESIISHRLAPQSLARGELISLKSPINPNRIICKRVIGLPGDTICVDPTGLKAPTTEHVFIPKGHIWIAGDNTSCSTDSRDYGPVSAALIRGRIVARVFPFNRFKIFTPDATYIDEH